MSAVVHDLGVSVFGISNTIPNAVRACVILQVAGQRGVTAAKVIT